MSFLYNPYPGQFSRHRSTQYEPTLAGGYVTDYGYILQDSEFELKWAVMLLADYNAFLALYEASSAEYVFYDPYANEYHVVMTECSMMTYLRGGSDAVEGVTMKLRVISSP